MTNLFSELGLPKAVVDAVTDLGYITPTPVQQQAIPALLNFLAFQQADIPAVQGNNGVTAHNPGCPGGRTDRHRQNGCLCTACHLEDARRT